MSENKTDNDKPLAGDTNNSDSANHVEQPKLSDESNKSLVKEKTAALKSKESKKVEAEKSRARVSTPSVDAKKGSTKAAVITGLTLLLALLAVIAAAYLWQQGQQQSLNLKEQLSLLQQQQGQQQQRGQQLASELRSELEQQRITQQQQRQAYERQLNGLQLAVKTQQKKLQSLATTDREDWLLAEAEYLMKLANQRLLMGKEITGAAELLSAADEILRDFEDASLYAVRKILAEEIMALNAAARFDLEGLYLRLGALAVQLDQVELFKAPQLSITSAAEPAADPEANWQQRILTSYEQAVQKLSRYIQINRRDEVYKPMLAPDQEAAVRHSMRLMIEQAQLALLAGKQNLYAQSLVKAQQWMNEYYAIKPEQVAAINVVFEQLKQQSIKVNLPDISASSRALKTYIETVHEIPVKKTRPSTSPSSPPKQTAGEGEGGTL